MFKELLLGFLFYAKRQLVGSLFSLLFYGKRFCSLDLLGI